MIEEWRVAVRSLLLFPDYEMGFGVQDLASMLGNQGIHSRREAGKAMQREWGNGWKWFQDLRLRLQDLAFRIRGRSRMDLGRA